MKAVRHHVGQMGDLGFPFHLLSTAKQGDNALSGDHLSVRLLVGVCVHLCVSQIVGRDLLWT